MCAVWVGMTKKSVEQGCPSSRILSASCRRKSANPGSPGKENIQYHHASWQGGLFAQYPFPAGPSDVADRSGTLRPRRGEELDLAMEPPGPLWAPGPLQAPAEEEKRTFGPEFWALMLQEIWKIQSRPCEDPHNTLNKRQRSTTERVCK